MIHTFYVGVLFTLRCTLEKENIAFHFVLFQSEPTLLKTVASADVYCCLLLLLLLPLLLFCCCYCWYCCCDCSCYCNLLLRFSTFIFYFSLFFHNLINAHFSHRFLIKYNNYQHQILYNSYTLSLYFRFALIFMREFHIFSNNKAL